MCFALRAELNGGEAKERRKCEVEDNIR
jgi:hypothetical protein